MCATSPPAMNATAKKYPSEKHRRGNTVFSPPGRAPKSLFSFRRTKVSVPPKAAKLQGRRGNVFLYGFQKKAFRRWKTMCYSDRLFVRFFRHDRYHKIKSSYLCIQKETLSRFCKAFVPPSRSGGGRFTKHCPRKGARGRWRTVFLYGFRIIFKADLVRLAC